VVHGLQQVTKRHLRRSKSLVSVMLWGGTEEFDSDKAKNVHQTEILVDLREAILQVARHFQSIDPKNSRVVCTLIVLTKCLYCSPAGDKEQTDLLKPLYSIPRLPNLTKIDPT